MMDLPSAVLLTSAVAYLTCAIIPRQVLQIQNLVLEKVMFLLLAALLFANTLILDLWILWILMGAMWSVAAIMSYLGDAKWNVQWRGDVSDSAQMFMAGWDLTISVMCFLKVAL